ncbi:hypothetical protein [Paraburkholderia sp. DGU8]|uniref:hypothetical protein n=1 Tax=Paraburkholderia sp. DGU8 TaxID=3161997 RepID=UPI0034651BC6
MKMWGKYGAFWGGLWGLLMGGVFLTIPVLGPIVVLGHLAVVIVSAVEGAVVVGTLSALGATLVNAGLPTASVIHYEAAIQADGFIVMAHGAPDEMARAKAVLATHQPARLDSHEGVMPTEPATPETI